MGDVPSAAEHVKASSRHLRGKILEELHLQTDEFSKETIQVLRFHGTYQQKDRDAKKTGQPPAIGSMVRVGVPGGLLKPEQYLALDCLADEAGDGSLRVTARQDIQFHKVKKARLKPLIRTLNQNLLSTLAACGDVVRNVIACPAATNDRRWHETVRYALALSKRLKPATRGYYEIWVDGERTITAEPAPDETEPLYGETYLPRKFKIGFAPPGDNCVDIYAQDVGIIPEYGTDRVEGFTIVAGGGLGASPGVKATHPRLASPVAFIAPDQLTSVVEAIIGIHRDFGNRSNRKLARLKYVIDEWGFEKFRAELQQRLGAPLVEPRPLEWRSGHDHLGWHDEGDGFFYLGVRVINGRIVDRPGSTLRSALRKLAAGGAVREIRLTPQQNVLLTGVATADRAGVERTLREAGIPMAEELPSVLKHSMACPALPTCGQAVTEAERISPEVISDLRQKLGALGLDEEDIVVRITGCHNGCARPLTAEIGIVGQSVDLYSIFLGGSTLGTRLAFPFATNVKRSEIGASLEPVFAQFRDRRLAGEPFGDFCRRLGVEALQSRASEAEVA
jgi:sulfite reductase (ferredoxin)